jgi:integrase
VPPEVARYLRAGMSAATRRAYLGDLRDFVMWGGTVPCAPMVLARYVAERAARHRPSTVERRVVGIGRAHAACGLPDPSKSELVRAVVQGIRREHGGRQRQATPLMHEDLLALLDRLPNNARGARDRALILLGFAAAMRRSELVGVDVRDLRFTPQGMVVLVRRSKTDQEGVGREIAVPLGRTSVCPVAGLQEWLQVARIESGPVFRAVNMAGVVSSERLSDQVVSMIVKRAVATIGLPAETYSGHSLRSGLVTSAARMGVDALMIQQQTGHRTLAMVSRYVRGGNRFAGNAAGVLL